MTLQNNEEELAKLFHETYERLAPNFTYHTRKASAVPWEDVPANNKGLMIATAKVILEEYVEAYSHKKLLEGKIEELKQLKTAYHDNIVSDDRMDMEIDELIATLTQELEGSK